MGRGCSTSLSLLDQLWEPRLFLCTYSDPGGWQCRPTTRGQKSPSSRGKHPSTTSFVHS